jgi:hypothetical protein
VSEFESVRLANGLPNTQVDADDFIGFDGWVVGDALESAFAGKKTNVRKGRLPWSTREGKFAATVGPDGATRISAIREASRSNSTDPTPITVETWQERIDGKLVLAVNALAERLDRSVKKDRHVALDVIEQGQFGPVAPVVRQLGGDRREVRLQDSGQGYMQAVQRTATQVATTYGLYAGDAMDVVAHQAYNAESFSHLTEVYNGALRQPAPGAAAAFVLRNL